MRAKASEASWSTDRRKSIEKAARAAPAAARPRAGSTLASGPGKAPRAMPIPVSSARSVLDIDFTFAGASSPPPAKSRASGACARAPRAVPAGTSNAAIASAMEWRLVSVMRLSIGSAARGVWWGGSSARMLIGSRSERGGALTRGDRFMRCKVPPWEIRQCPCPRRAESLSVA